MEEKFKNLAQPFKEDDIEWRVQRCGEKNNKIWAMVLCYVTNRAIMNRLDDVIGAGNWKNYYESTPTGKGTLCGIAIRIKDEWVTKWDGAEDTAIEAVKGGLSGAMKRAAVQWGIGRYLYNLDEGYADICPDGENYTSDKKLNKSFKWNPPSLPSWALPDVTKQTQLDPEDKSGNGGKPPDPPGDKGEFEQELGEKEEKAECVNNTTNLLNAFPPKGKNKIWQFVFKEVKVKDLTLE